MICEILAPAGSPEALTAAVRCSADAVYLGAGRFNARQGAQNFDDLQLADAVRYCHARGVRVHLTLNTLVSDSEIPDALDQLEKACKAGVDAIIVQDIGLASLIRKAAPDVELHASTQMSVHSPSALLPLKEAGFSRVVLARELSRDEIAAICAEAKRLGLETEVFVHGALCMCLSGQCYMSGVIGQRSGNRGMCAQPCRLEYQNGQYPLSLRDLSLIDRVDELCEMGVTSFKIEGRMKRPEYVAAAVSAFRAKVDTGSVPDELRQALSGVFSRSGHTDGYYTGKLGSQMFGRRTAEDAAASSSALSGIHSLYRAEKQTVPLSVSLKVYEGEPIKMTATAKDISVTASGDIAERAINRPLDSQRARTSCAKLGGTPFFLDRFELDTKGIPAVSDSQINALRRQCCGLLTKSLGENEKSYFPPELPERIPRQDKQPKLFARFEDISQIPENASKLDRIYLPLGSDIPHLGTETGVEVPRALFAGEDKIFNLLTDAREKGAEYALCHNIAAIALAKKAGFKIHAGFGMNVFNSVSAHLLKYHDVTLSFELMLSMARDIGSGGILAYGRLPIMLTRNCPMGGKKNCAGCPHSLTDRKNAEFPVICRGYYSEIYNSVPLLIDQSRDRLGKFDFLELYFTDEDKTRCSEIIDGYLNGHRPDGQFTRGLYYRGV